MRWRCDALAHEVLGAAVRVGEEHAARVVDDAAVDLFGHAVVEAAVARLHVTDADAHALGDERGDAGVRVAEDEHGVGLLGEEDLLGLGEHLADLVGESGAAHAHVDVGLAHAHLAEEHAGEAVVVVLAGVHQDVVAGLVEHGDDARQADDLRARAEQGEDFGHLGLQVALADDVGDARLEELARARRALISACSEL